MEAYMMLEEVKVGKGRECLLYYIYYYYSKRCVERGSWFGLGQMWMIGTKVRKMFAPGGRNSSNKCRRGTV
ncbi:hypothetical protein MUK42_33128 [Musa troglodytarum]|uniref:Uncharacterized protein n=1 Tax=Musa troglodytarum TaxID=320322 RepID=A0A9E7IAK4_9LILI|nr:hypothetical protein MUK42_33128 [Musa troglodytarum]